MGGLLSKTTVAPLYLPFTASICNLSLSRVSGDVNRTSAQRADEIALYMTFGKAFQIAVKFVFTASFRQGFIPNKKRDNVKDFVQILTAFLHQFEVFFELVSEGKIKHGLYI